MIVAALALWPNPRPSETPDRNGWREVAFGAEASLAGLYARDLGRGSGHDLLAVAHTAFEFWRREVARDGGTVADEIILVRLPGVTLEHRSFLGATTVPLRLDAALTFGGVRSHALLGEPRDRSDLPLVTQLHGYYHGIGGLLAPRAELEVGPVEVGAGARLDALAAVTAGDPAPAPPGGYADLDDGRVELEGWASWHLPWRGVEVGATVLRRTRFGRADEAVRRTDETGGTAALLNPVLIPRQIDNLQLIG